MIALTIYKKAPERYVRELFPLLSPLYKTDIQFQGTIILSVCFLYFALFFRFFLFRFGIAFALFG